MADGCYKLTWRKRICFCSGDVAQNIIYQTVSIWLLFYYTNVYGTVLASCMLMANAQGTTNTLKAAYGDNFLVGVAVSHSFIEQNNTKCLNLITEQFSAVSPEDVMKPETIHPAPDVWNFQKGDEYCKFANMLPFSKEGQMTGKAMFDPALQREEFMRYLNPYKDGLPAEVDREIADRYEELMRVIWNNRDKIARVTFWGLHDGVSWKNDYPIPNRTNYPLLFDRNLNPKEAFNRIISIPGK